MRRLLTTGVTAAPDFMLRNFIRDAVHAYAINKDGFRFGVDSLRGLEAFDREPLYRQMIAGGAAFQGGYVHATDPEMSSQIVRRATMEKGLNHSDGDSLLDTAEKMYHVVHKILGKIQTLARNRKLEPIIDV
jgi:hypothetical protein